MPRIITYNPSVPVAPGRVFDVFLMTPADPTMIQLRLREHASFVDRFIAVSERRERANVTDSGAGVVEGIETVSRDNLVTHLKQVTRPGDIIMFTHVDEIVNGYFIKTIAPLSSVMSLEMNVYRYHGNWRRKQPSRLAKIGPRSCIDFILDWRGMSDTPVVPSAGWHLSCFLPFDELKRQMPAITRLEYGSLQCISDNELILSIEMGGPMVAGPSGAGEDHGNHYTWVSDPLPQHVSLLPSPASPPGPFKQSKYNIYICPGTVEYLIEIAQCVSEYLNSQVPGSLNSVALSGSLDINCTNVVFGLSSLVYKPNSELHNQILRLAQDNHLIVFNLEQLHDSSPWMREPYLTYLKKYPVWDYNQSNQKYLLKRFGKQSAVFTCGYCPSLSKRLSNEIEDIDVLFIGAHCERRQTILDSLRATGLHVVHKEKDCFGIDRDILLSRSKIVLNIHYYETCLFEFPRITYLLHNSRFIISETASDDSEYAQLHSGMVIVPYTSLVDTVLSYVHNPQKRHEIATRGYELIKQRVSSLNVPSP